VHGVPSKSFILKDGDFVKVDVVGSYKGYCADMARYFFVGQTAPAAQKIADVAQKSLDAALAMVAPGVELAAISGRIQQIVEDAGFGVVRQFAGHGIGKCMHEEPDVPNYAEGAPDLRLREGMTLAIEPMITEGSYDVVFSKDGWTAKTADGKLAAHVEDTVLVTAHGAEILTRL
jgi:methionyl aminopeptidase